MVCVFFFQRVWLYSNADARVHPIEKGGRKAIGRIESKENKGIIISQMVHNTGRDRRKCLNKEPVTPFDTMVNAKNHGAQRSAAMALFNKTGTGFTDTLARFAPIRRDNSPASPSWYVPAVSARVQSWPRRKAKKRDEEVAGGRVVVFQDPVTFPPLFLAS